MEELVLSNAHWTIEAYQQRMATKKWKAMLLSREDKIIVGGNIRQLKAKNLGYGIVEVFKEPLSKET